VVKHTARPLLSLSRLTRTRALVGFTLEATQGGAVKITGSNNVIKNCVIRNVGDRGVDIRAGINNVVMTSELYNMVHCLHALTHPRTHSRHNGA
jgi:hypothetical protein